MSLSPILFALPVPVQFMRDCPLCGEAVFIAGWQCAAGYVGYCVGCQTERIAAFTRANSEE